MRALPPKGATERDVHFSLNELIRRNNTSGTVTLTASATSTAISNTNINSGGFPILIPKTANAAAALATTYATVTSGLLTLTHANNAQTDRTFYWAVLGG